MKRQAIEHAFPIVAAALGRRLGVTVRFGGDDAYTNGQLIHLPALDLASSAREAAWGFLVHEAAHVRFTDYDQWARVQAAPLRAAFANAAEDIRIEQAMARAYPGTKRMLDDALAHVLRQGGMQPPTTNDGLAQVVFGYVLAAMRYQHLDQHALVDTVNAAGEELDKRLTGGVRTRLDVLIDQAGRLASTQEAIALADRLIQTLEEAEQEARERAQQGDRQDSGASASQSPSSTDDGGEAAADGAATDAQPGAADGGDPDAGGDSQGAEVPAQAASTAAESRGGDGAAQHDRTVADALRSVLDAAGEDLGSNLGEQLAETLSQAHRREHRSTTTTPIVPLSTQQRPWRRNATAADALEASRRLQARLRGLIEASQRRRPVTGRRGKRIDGKRVSRIGIGDPRVLRREADKVAPNAAVHLLVDQSSSMNGNDRHNLAMGAALALSAALGEINSVSPGVTSFSSDGCARIVEHGESPRRCAARFYKSAAGNTPMAEAMLSALTPLVAQRHERKLLIVVTDGQPNGDTGSDGVREIVRRCAAGSVEVLGIGIGVDLSHLFERWTSIAEVGQLRERLFDLTHRSLMPAA